ncbi:class II fructose-bisphosphatase [Fictibacillus enclensis]|uniref:class II fructose-bisphosphatase n=1 Tax=Fictibacillus enclensis TaxID=1017270 RepID=UPI0025A29012|nr:class II fructose-bisphosphatase [Fictibacillus enclensis]MDM5200801.1 class II fructose-bisphosphatase [Fictibacillus enclensis]
MSMKLDNKEDIQQLAMDFLAVAQEAAIASYPWVGKGKKNEADGAGTEAMRTRMGSIAMDGTVVIGEGELDEAPMLYIGERVGTGSGPMVDIAVDPVEGTTLMSKGQDNALTVIAVAEKEHLLHAPDMYMRKIAVGPKAKGKIDIEAPLTENIRSVARSLGKDVSEVTVMIQDRSRHQSLIQEVFEAGAKVKLFSDGDVTGAIATGIEDIGVDLLVGTGGAPEGVIAAAALRSLGGDFQAQLVCQNEEEFNRCIGMGLSDPGRILRMEDLVRSDRCFFVATGITDGILLNGVRKKADGSMLTQSFITIGGRGNNFQFVETRH